MERCEIEDISAPIAESKIEDHITLATLEERERKAYELARAIFDSAPFGINVWDDDYNLIETGRRSPELFEVPDRETYIKEFFNLSPKYQPCGTLSHEKAKAYLTRAYQEGSISFEWMHETMNGKPFPSEITLVRSERDGKTMLLGYTADLRAVKDAEALNDKLLANTPLLIELWDMDGNMLDCSDKMLEMFGIGGKAEMGERFFDFCAPVQPCGTPVRELNMLMINRAMQEGNCRTEWMFVLPDGEELPTESTWAHITHLGKPMIIVYSQDLRPLRAADTEVRDANELTRVLLDSSPLIINVWDDTLKLISTSRQAVEMFGLSGQEEYLMRFAELSPEFQPCGTPSGEKAISFVKQAFSEGSVKFEWMHQTLSGEPLPAEITLVRFTRQDRYFVAAYTVDLRPLKAAMAREHELEKKLLEQELDERTLLVVDSSPISVIIFDDNRTPTDCNNEAVNTFGFADKEHFIEAFDNRFYDFFQPVQPCGTPTDEKINWLFDKITSEDGMQNMEWRMLTADGEDLPVYTNFRRINHRDTFIFVAYIRDLREVKAYEEEVRAAKEFSDALYKASPMFIDVWDEDFNLIGCNDKVCDLLGVPNKEEFLNNLAEKYNPEFQPCGTNSVDLYNEKFKIGLDEGYVKYDWTHLDVNGEEVPLEVTYVRIISDGKRVLVGYNYDLRDMKKAQMERQRVEIAEESNKAKSRFLARMSHEIRTPITAVLGISEIQMQNTALPPAQEEAFAKIHDSSNMLLGIINDILDLSKFEVGKMSLTCEEYDVASLISDAVQTHTVFLGYKDIKFCLHVDDALPKLLIGDALRIKQIMNNILSNAFKYTESGTVELHLECQRDDEEHITLVITVRDTGFGMTPEQVDTLYRQEYIRFHENEARSISGTGLGMSIVCNLVQLMDARIDVESEVGKGTTVVVRIPQKVAGAEVLGKETAESLRRFEVSADSASKKFKFTPEPMPYGRVLVVDDVDANLYVAKGLLSFYGLDIETCDSGYAAIEKIKQGNVYDIVFMDQMMPEIDGTGTMRAMRELGYAEPIIALTANALIGQAEEFIESGFDGFLSKPIHTVHLNTVLIKHIRDKQPPEVIAAANSAGTAAAGTNTPNIDDYQRNPDLLRKLRANFAREQKSLLTDIKQALYTDDLNTAHRLVHTLKSSAWLIHEATLAQVAGQVEDSLRDGRVPTEKQLSVLEIEVTRVLENIGKTEPAALSGDKVFDKDRAIALLNELAPMLDSNNSDCLNLLDELGSIPETAVLVRLIEEFEFTTALKIVGVLMAVLEEQ